MFNFFIATAIGAFITRFIWSKIRASQRISAFHAAAEALDWSFAPTERNLPGIKGEFRGYSVRIFDVRFTYRNSTSSIGSNTSAWKITYHTVIQVEGISRHISDHRIPLDNLEALLHEAIETHEAAE